MQVCKFINLNECFIIGDNSGDKAIFEGGKCPLCHPLEKSLTVVIAKCLSTRHICNLAGAICSLLLNMLCILLDLSLTLAYMRVFITNFAESLTSGLRADYMAR